MLKMGCRATPPPPPLWIRAWSSYENIVGLILDQRFNADQESIQRWLSDYFVGFFTGVSLQDDL